MENSRRGAILSDGEIREAIQTGELEITGWPELYIGPSSVDMHLDNKAMVIDPDKVKYSLIDNEKGMDFMGLDVEFVSKSSELFSSFNGWPYIILYPQELYIMSTVERIKFPANIIGFIQGRSSIARIGINVHNAGYFDAGFEGTATLEVTNLTKYPIKIKKHTRICQMVFARTGRPAEIPYNEKKDQKYNNQSGPAITRLYKEFDGDERTHQLN